MHAQGKLLSKESLWYTNVQPVKINKTKVL